MAIIAGIDEAGLGPVLGPLVVSATAFEVPEELLDASLWRVLAGAVCRKASGKGVKVPIADSKKLYSSRRTRGLADLERGVLGMLATQGHRPDSLAGLLGLIAPAAVGETSGYPWYAGDDLALPTRVTPTNLTLTANALRVVMQRKAVRLCGIWAEPVFVGEFNRHVTATNNKATMLFDVTSRLLARLLRDGSGGALRVYVDRHGGRMRYLPALQRAFHGRRFRILLETDRHSAYHIAGAGSEAEVHFLTGGEDMHLPVALASMVSKYLRELFMKRINRFWAHHVPGLAPTAGYYNDGRRFYQQIVPAARRLGVSDHLLYRCR